MAFRVESLAEPIAGYRLLDRLGGGGFGEVWKAEAPGGLHKAIKIIHGDLRTTGGDNARLAEQELKALKRVQSIRHPYLLSLERYDIVDGRLLIVMELADCNLWDRFREYRNQGQPGIPRPELLRYMEEAAEVLDMMNNQHQLQHLDIKPQNLFLIYNHVKVADFGLVKDLEGMRGEITGGVTPVYAAPETFDGVVTRFCDQYSLAIVYQELLTGVRPFNGSTLQQLLMQHLQGAPNLNPLPLSDRPAIARALQKKPEDRFASCLHLVRALQATGGDMAVGSGQPAPPAGSGSRAETPRGNWNTVPPLPPPSGTPLPPPSPPPETPRTIVGFRPADPSAKSSAAGSQPARAAPPEVRGEGALFPAVIIGLGGQAGSVLRAFRRQIADRFGPLDRMPNLKLLYIDTDPESLQNATDSGGRGALAGSEVVPARLNRPGHYLKPRRNGRSLIEGWFDPQMLYRIPRNPETLGIRAFGRLAFCDHYRIIANRLRESIEAVTHADSLSQSDRQSRLGLRSNRPRVYVVAGLTGGTGSGMLVDMAYAARHRLRQLGYTEPDVVGVLLAPPLDTATPGPGSLSNCYATLRELNHFSLPNAVFSASYDDRDGAITDRGAPFSRVFVLPGMSRPQVATAPGEQRDACRHAGEFLRRELTTLVGRTADNVRDRQAQRAPQGVHVQTAGSRSFTWPRQVVLTMASRWLGEVLLTRWIAAGNDALREAVRGWLAPQWDADELGPEPLIAALQNAIEKSAGQPPDDLFNTEAQPFVPRGWFARDPDPAKLWQSVAKLQQFVGQPDERAMQRQVGQWELVLSETADQLARQAGVKVMRYVTTLLEDPKYRLAGAEVAVEQLQAMIDQLLKHYEPLGTELATKAIDAYTQILKFLAGERGKRKLSAADLAECLRMFPKWRYQSLVLRHVSRVYLTIRSQLGDQLRDLRFCRQRLEELVQRLRNATLDPPQDPESQLLPPGCTSIEQAVEALKRQVQPGDCDVLDRSLQAQIEREFHGLFSACMTSVNVLGTLQGIVEEQTRSFLAARLGESDLVEMFLARFGDTERSSRALRLAYDDAVPTIVKPSQAERGEVCLLGIPPGEAGEPFQHVARRALLNREIELAPSTDEILIHREYTRLPLTDLPQLGPLTENAYTQALYSNAAPPHARTDVSEWADVEPE